MDNTTHS